MRYDYSRKALYHCTDIAATVPPEAFGYEHVGRLFFLTARGKLLTNPGRWTMFRHKVSGELGYAARFPWFRRGMVKVRSFVDHSILVVFGSSVVGGR